MQVINKDYVLKENTHWLNFFVVFDNFHDQVSLSPMKRLDVVTAFVLGGFRLFQDFFKKIDEFDLRLLLRNSSLKELNATSQKHKKTCICWQMYFGLEGSYSTTPARLLQGRSIRSKSGLVDFMNK